MPIASPSTDDLRVFVRVARLSSFTRAAEQLQLPRATVSTAVLRLESRLGARLLQRTTRRVQLTSDGLEFLDRCERLLADLDELGALFQHRSGQVSGRLRVDMPLGMAAGRVMARLPELLRAYPALAIEVHSADRRVDPVAEGFDCVIRVGKVVDESLAARPLARCRWSTSRAGATSRRTASPARWTTWRRTGSSTTSPTRPTIPPPSSTSTRRAAGPCTCRCAIS